MTTPPPSVDPTWAGTLLDITKLAHTRLPHLNALDSFFNNWEEDSICNLLALLAGKEVLSKGNDEIECITLRGPLPSRVFVPHSWKPGMLLLTPLGSLRPQQKFFFLLGQPQKARFLQKTCLNEEILAVQVDAICVWKTKNL